VAAAKGAGSFPPAGVAACFAALVAGTAGTVYQKRHGEQIPLLSGTAVQYAAAALALLLAAGARVSRELGAMSWPPARSTG